MQVVYEQLRRLAHAKIANEPGGGAGQTLEPSALVHEAYLRLMSGGTVHWQNPGHFFGAAALAMRRILVERARARAQLKRGGGRDRIPLSQVPGEEAEEPVDLLALDDALEALEREDRRKSEVVCLRYFAGLSLEQVAEALGASLATVKRDWSYARAWLYDRMNPPPPDQEPPAIEPAHGRT